MRIMIGIGHPKQVHFWKNIVKKLIEHGHEVNILTIDKDVTLGLLEAYGFDYEIYGVHQKSTILKACGILNSTPKALAVASRFKPDILIAGTPYLAYVSKIVRKPHITLIDTEHAGLTYLLTYPFTDVVCTPSCFKGKINPKKHVTFGGYFELAYLHPNYFKPDIGALEMVGLNKNDKFTILRFVAWTASHDRNQSGITNEMKIRYISELEQYGRVFISSESKLKKEFEKYKLKISPEKFHSLLSFAHLYIGEGGTTATEAAVLGTPSIHVSTTAQFCGNFDELHDKYELVYTFSDDKQALEKALKVLENPNSKKEWTEKKDKMLKEKIDVTEFMTKLIENFPSKKAISYV